MKQYILKEAFESLQKLDEKNEFRGLTQDNLKKAKELLDIKGPLNTSTLMSNIIPQIFSSQFFDKLYQRDNDLSGLGNLNLGKAPDGLVYHHIYNSRKIPIVVTVSPQEHGRLHRSRYGLLSPVLTDNADVVDILKQLLDKINNIRFSNSRVVTGSKVQIPNKFIQELISRGVSQDIIDQAKEAIHSGSYTTDQSKDPYGLTESAITAAVNKIQRLILADSQLCKKVMEILETTNIESIEFESLDKGIQAEIYFRNEESFKQFPSEVILFLNGYKNKFIFKQDSGNVYLCESGYNKEDQDDIREELENRYDYVSIMGDYE